MPSMRTCARVSLKGVKEVQKCQSRKNLLTREASYKVPHASLRGQRGSKEDGTHLQNGVFQPIVATVTHPPWIGIFLSFVSGLVF
jgi:hypothetical protein